MICWLEISCLEYVDSVFDLILLAAGACPSLPVAALSLSKPANKSIPVCKERAGIDLFFRA